MLRTRYSCRTLCPNTMGAHSLIVATVMLRIFSVFVLLLLVSALALSSPALAWSRFGHEVVGHLAEHDLSPGARAGVVALLGEQSLADVASWADEVRPDRPETAPLHYVNGPLDRLVPRQADFDLPQGNVYSAILGYAERIVDASLSERDRIEALKFFVHFVGDLHQPLHAGFAEDRGANDVAVVYQGEVINLHRYWDNQILDRPRARFDSREFAAVLHARYSDSERVRWTDLTDPRDWVIEARRLIFNGLYPRPRGDVATPDQTPIAVIDESYADVWQPVAELQLARAGARLARALNELFETSASPFRSPPIPFPPPARDR
ncbi:MAG: hypothetical protein EA419_03795 [Wenzhouxiangella sp.]|nr:MAG: hypothetical protein EA419_03795 [Wenzhouxiangella sp.]